MKQWAVVDVETSGLDPAKHELIEVGIVLEDGDRIAFSLRFDPERADPKALEINGWGKRPFAPMLSDDAAARAMEYALGEGLVVASPSWFDFGFLAAWYRERGYPVPWNHRAVVDLKSYALAKLGRSDALSNSTIAEALRVPDTSDHTALADAEFTARMWQELLAL